jgi:adenosine deaminase CECR1
MTVADSPKKRKRAPSPLPTRKIPLHIEETKATAMPLGLEIMGKGTDPRTTFDDALKDINLVNKYDKEHKQLLEREEESSWDCEARSNSDPIEKKAARIIWAIREYERANTFGNMPSEAIPKQTTRDMGGQYLTNKERIDNESKLYEIAKLVPKGALLHLHFNAELHPELLLVRAREMKNMYIRSIIPLISESSFNLTEVVFSIMDPDKVNPDVDIFHKDYDGKSFNPKKENPTVWMLWWKFQDKFEAGDFSKKYRQQEPETFQAGRPHSCGDQGQMRLRPAENWVRSKMVLSQEEAYGFTQTVNG